MKKKFYNRDSWLLILVYFERGLSAYRPFLIAGFVELQKLLFLDCIVKFEFTALKGSQFLFLFAITAAGVVPCGGPKKSPRTSSIVQIIFSFWSFEVSEGILRNQKIITGLDSFSNQCYILAPF